MFRDSGVSQESLPFHLTLRGEHSDDQSKAKSTLHDNGTSSSFSSKDHQNFAHCWSWTSSVRNSGTLLVPESDPQFTIVAKALRQIQIPSLSGTLKALGPALCRLGPPHQ